MSLRAPDLILRMYRKENSPRMSLRGPKGRGNLLHHWQKSLVKLYVGFDWLCFSPSKTAKITKNTHKPWLLLN